MTAVHDGRAGALAGWIAARVAARVGPPVEAVDHATPLADFGLTSRDALGLLGELETEVGRTLPVSVLWDHPSVGALSRHLAEPSPAGPHTTEPPSAAPVPPEGIAVVGLDCRLSGADGADAFWRLPADGLDTVGDGTERAGVLGTHVPHGLLADVAGFFSVSKP